MARLVGVFNTAHTPFCYMPPERWNEVRAQRSLREDVPFDDLDENRRKSQRIRDAFATLRGKVNEVSPDVIDHLLGGIDPILRLAVTNQQIQICPGGIVVGRAELTLSDKFIFMVLRLSDEGD